MPLASPPLSLPRALHAAPSPPWVPFIVPVPVGAVRMRRLSLPSRGAPTGAVGCDRWTACLGIAYERAREWCLASMGKSDPCSGSDGPLVLASSICGRVGTRLDPHPFLVLLTYHDGSMLFQNVGYPPSGECPMGAATWGGPRGIRRVPLACVRCVVRLVHDGCSSSRMRKTLWARGPRPLIVPKNERSTPCANDGRPRLGRA